MLTYCYKGGMTPAGFGETFDGSGTLCGIVARDAEGDAGTPIVPVDDWFGYYMGNNQKKFTERENTNLGCFGEKGDVGLGSDFAGTTLRTKHVLTISPFPMHTRRCLHPDLHPRLPQQCLYYYSATVVLSCAVSYLLCCVLSFVLCIDGAMSCAIARLRFFGWM